MLQKKNFLIAIVFSFICATLLGQELHTDIARINSNYSADKAFKMNMSVSLLEGGKQIESLNYYYLQNKNKNIFRVAGISTVVLDSFILIIDERIKNIVLSTIKTNVTNNITNTYDSLLSMSSSHSFTVIDSGKLNQYTLKFKKLEYDKIEIYFNPQTYALQRVKIYFINSDKKRKDQKIMEFMYSDLQPLDQKDRDLMECGTYYTVQKNKVILTKSYKDYELIDYREFYQN